MEGKERNRIGWLYIHVVIREGKEKNRFGWLHIYVVIREEESNRFSWLNKIESANRIFIFALYMRQTLRMRVRYRIFCTDSVDPRMILSIDAICKMHSVACHCA